MEQLRANISDDWKKTFFSIIIVCILSFSIFYQSWASIIEIWYRSKTFNHGFFIIPISLWLIWTRRNYYSTLTPSINWSILIAIGASGFLWLLADLIHVQVIKQFSTVSILVSSLCLVLGINVSLKLFFPLFFLFLMVPVGEELVPYLMEYTATFTVNLIRLTGMSVYREGLYFSLSSGNWSVVQACSGINYLIASITLGLVYAYISYQSIWKRCFFVLLSIIVPIIANGFRAYMIVMIGHFSDMTLAVGVDHIIYGGVFFGIVMLVLFYLGSFWKDNDIKTNIGADPSLNKVIYDDKIASFFYKKHINLFLIVIFSFSLWPFASSWLQQKQERVSSFSPVFTDVKQHGWTKTADPGWGWQADFKHVAEETLNYFTDYEHTVGIYTASFEDKGQGSGELVNSQNLLVNGKNLDWKIINNTTAVVKKHGDNRLVVDETILRSEDKDLLALRWFHVGKYTTANKYLAKVYQLIKRLKADNSPEFIIVAFIESQPNRYKEARIQLTNFIDILLKSRNNFLGY